MTAVDDIRNDLDSLASETFFRSKFLKFEMFMTRLLAMINIKNVTYHF